MIDEGIHENDTIIIDNKKIPNNGDIVVAFIDNEDVTLKRFRKKTKDWLLKHRTLC